MKANEQTCSQCYYKASGELDGQLLCGKCFIENYRGSGKQMEYIDTEENNAMCAMILYVESINILFEDFLKQFQEITGNELIPDFICNSFFYDHYKQGDCVNTVLKSLVEFITTNFNFEESELEAISQLRATFVSKEKQNEIWKEIHGRIPKQYKMPLKEIL